MCYFICSETNLIKAYILFSSPLYVIKALIKKEMNLLTRSKAVLASWTILFGSLFYWPLKKQSSLLKCFFL